MKIDYRNGVVTLSSGRSFAAYCGLLNPRPPSLVDNGPGQLVEGYDGAVSDLRESESTNGVALTDAERIEIALHMVAVWVAWAATGRHPDMAESKAIDLGSCDDISQHPTPGVTDPPGTATGATSAESPPSWLPGTGDRR